MTLKHTPGPWNYKIDITEKGFDVSSEKEIIASRYPAGWSEYDKIEMEANARLIAAAPEMLEVLIKCREILPLEYTAWIDQYIERATGQSIDEVLKEGKR